ncbi:hypothetical protein DV737_g4411, partial [Chaetothyriales sp. CBS 132003]
MPAFVVVPATPDDLGAIARVQFEAFGGDAGFQTIFPHGATPAALQYAVAGMENDMENDATAHVMLVKDGMTGEIASYAQWHFFPPRRQEQIDREMLLDTFPWPEDANAEAGNKLVRNATRKRHQVVAQWLGWGSPYAYLSVVGTAPRARGQGAASLLLKWGTERADDYNLPAYLEATKSGHSVYRKYGFDQVDHLPIEISQWGGQDFVNSCMIRPARATTDDPN